MLCNMAKLVPSSTSPSPPHNHIFLQQLTALQLTHAKLDGVAYKRPCVSIYRDQWQM